MQFVESLPRKPTSDCISVICSLLKDKFQSKRRQIDANVVNKLKVNLIETKNKKKANINMNVNFLFDSGNDGGDVDLC